MTDDKSEESAEESGSDEVQEQSVSLFLAIGMVVGALIVGLVVGYMVAPKEQTTLSDPLGGGSAAPSLSQEQLEGGTLPSGHPAIPEGAAPTGDTTNTTGAVDGETVDEATSTDAGSDSGVDADTDEGVDTDDAVESDADSEPTDSE